MRLKSFGTAAVIALTLAGTTAATVTPAAAWCGYYGRCGYGYGYGWRGGWGPGIAAGVLAGAAVGTAAAVAAGPRPYGCHSRPRSRASP